MSLIGTAAIGSAVEEPSLVSVGVALLRLTKVTAFCISGGASCLESVSLAKFLDEVGACGEGDDWRPGTVLRFFVDEIISVNGAARAAGRSIVSGTTIVGFLSPPF